MAETKYTRTFTTTCPTELIEFINNDPSITPVLLQIIEGAGVPGDSDFWFDDPLSTAGSPDEVNRLDAILATWECTDALETVGEAFFDVENVDVVTLEIGTPVYAVGFSGSPGVVQVKAADAGNPTTMPSIGVITQRPLDPLEFGIVASAGDVFGVDTSGKAVGNELYVAVGGGTTTTKPTGVGNLIQKIGVVLEVDATAGRILVAGAQRTNDVPNILQNHFWLGNASDVATPTLFQLDSLTDVDLTGSPLPATGDLLEFNGTNWVHMAPGTGTGSFPPPAGLGYWHETKVFGDDSGVGNKFLQALGHHMESNKNSKPMLSSGQIIHVSVSVNGKAPEPSKNAILQIVKNPVESGAGVLSGGTQIGTNLNKNNGLRQQLFTNLSGFTFAAGDIIACYLKKNPDDLKAPYVTIYIRYD